MKRYHGEEAETLSAREAERIRTGYEARIAACQTTEDLMAEFMEAPPARPRATLVD